MDLTIQQAPGCLGAVAGEAAGRGWSAPTSSTPGRCRGTELMHRACSLPLPTGRSPFPGRRPDPLRPG